MSDVRDRMIQDHAPTVMVPSFESFSAIALGANGHRFLAARDGLHIEVKRPWLHLVQPIAAAPIRLPYGEVPQLLLVAFGKIPRDMLARFVGDARKLSPHEHAALIIWNANTESLEYRDVDVQEFSRSEVRYNRPRLQAHESLAIDLHSHGELGAFFSSQDDEDDAGEVKISVVVGGLREGCAPEWKVRLCYMGVFMDLPGPKDL